MPETRRKNAKYTCVTGAGEKVIVLANVQDSVDDIKYEGWRKTGQMICEVLEENRLVPISEKEEFGDA